MDVPQLDYIVPSDGAGAEEGDEEDSEEETIDDTRLKFKPGHVREWWGHFLELPAEVRPVFSPTTGFSDVFHKFEERALKFLLWGKEPNNPTRPFLENKICTAEEADQLVKENYGELLRRLFIGDADSIKKDSKKQQTTYGKRTTTISELAEKAPDTFGVVPMRRYVDEKFEYLRRRKDLATTSSVQPTPPPLPTAPVPHRYAVSNYLQTDGLRVHLFAYDVTKPWVSPKTKSRIPEIKARFPDRSAITASLGDDPTEVTVVGIDPGEIISGSFCGLDPKAPNTLTNLQIRRSALYGPTLSHRQAMEDLKRRRPYIDQPLEISPDNWILPHQSAGYLELPCISELENSLPDKGFTSIEAYEKGLKDWWYVHDVLRGFYGSMSLKKWSWELAKATQAERDWAFHGALRVADPAAGAHGGPTRPVIFVYGDGQFRTATNLPSKHSAFRHFFYQKVCLNHIDVSYRGIMTNKSAVTHACCLYRKPGDQSRVHCGQGGRVLDIHNVPSLRPKRPDVKTRQAVEQELRLSPGRM